MSGEASSPGRAPAARQPDPVLRRQPHLDRGRHRRRVQRGRAQALRGLRLAHPARRLRRGRRRARGGDRRRQGESPTSRRSSRCAPSSAGRRRPSRTPARPTGSALGEDEIRATKEILGFDPDVHFDVDADVLAHARQVVERGRDAHGEWQTEFEAWAAANPERAGAARPDGRRGSCPTAGPTRCRSSRPRRTARPTRCPPAPRRARCSTALADVLPELWGGSADLAESNNTTMEGEPSFIPAEHQTKTWTRRPVRPHAALRHPRARDGRDHERHHAARRHPRLRRHVPGVQRLHAPAGAAGRADEAAGRSTCGRTTRSASAGTARPTSRSSTSPRCARSPASTSCARRTRTRPRCAGSATLEHTDRPGRPGAVAGRTCRCSTRPKVGRRRRRAATSSRRRSTGLPAGDPDRHRLGGLARAGGPRAARGRGHADPGRLDAVRGVVPRAAAVLPAAPCCRPTSGPG